MAEDTHNEHLIKELTQLLEPVLTGSPQAVYLYLDDTHKACNQKFADLIGYTSPEEWVANENPIDDVDEEDQERTVKAYMNASTNLKASEEKINLVKKDGEKISVEVIFVPLSYRNEIFVLHFIERR